MEATISIPPEMAEKALVNAEQIISSIKAGTFSSPLFKSDAPG
ncbi:hypothetical protein PCH70_04210 [Pseudomonas cichorii JBC1]|nr:hypothetical protein PCH70_04210 [Pseudomonas cichorii JBC1]